MRDTMESYSLLAKASAAAVLCTVVTAVLYTVTTIAKRRKLPPGPFPLPIIGNMLSLGTRPHQTYVEFAKKYGNIFTIYLGSARAVVVTNAAMAKEVLQVQDAKCAHRPVHDLMYTMMKYMSPDGESSMCWLWNPQVREMKQICDRHLMLPRRVEATRGLRREEVWRIVGKIAAGGDSPIDMRHLFEELAFRFSCRAAFNKAFVDSEKTGDSTLSPEVFWTLILTHNKLVVEQNPSDIIPLLKPLGDVFGVNKKWREVYPPFLQFANKLQAWYRKNAPDADQQEDVDLDYMEILMRKAKEGFMTDFAVDELSLEMVIAGADSTSATMEWSLLELVRHPEMMQKVRAEIEAKFGDSAPVEEEALVELPYLQAVLKESLRLHYAVPLSIPHYTMEDTVLAGYAIPAHTSIFIVTYAIQRNPEDWGADALEFNPDRFLARNVNPMGSADLSYLPFSAGRHICPGRIFAMHGIAMALAALVHAFDWEAIPGYELSAEESVGGLNLRPIQPVVLRAVPRPQLSLYQ